jgi:two-component system response regulator RegA
MAISERDGCGKEHQSWLIIDDDGFHRDRLVRDLQALGRVVSMESTPEGALARVRDDLVDCVCIEPVLRGLYWFRFLREFGNLRRPRPWAVVTAFPSGTLVTEAIRLGATGVFAKPATVAELTPDVGHKVHTLQPPTNDLDLSLAHMEWEHLNRVLRLCDGNIAEASRRLRIPRQSLYNKLRKAPAQDSPPVRRKSADAGIARSSDLVAEAISCYGIEPDALIVHQDRGAPWLR